MKSFLTTTAIASAFVLGSFVAAPLAMAQDAQSTTKECIGDNCPGAGGAMKGGEEQKAPEQRTRRKGSSQDQNGEMTRDSAEGQSTDQDMKRKKRAENKRDTDVNVDVDVNTRTRTGMNEGSWHFDPNRHHRRRSKSASFRFYYGGFWYPQPYWETYSIRVGRIGCGEGRRIVAERFNRVRVVECNGGTYTYLGRRQGDTYRILLNARSGRIVGRTLI